MEVNLVDNSEKLPMYETVVDELKEMALLANCDGEYLEKILNHHVINGCIYNGIPLMTVFKLIAPNSKQTEEYYKLARYLIAICDLFISAYNVVDDILDNGEMRFGLPCWHRVVGKEVAANDSHILLASAFAILRKHFSNLDCYTNLMELMTETVFITAMGQHLDEKMSRENLDSFTQENFDKITKPRTSFGFYYSFGAIFILAGLTEPAIKKAQEFMFEIGYLFQIQNDFWDYFEYVDASYKSGTDIEVGKCSWMAVQCLKMASPEQKEIFYSCYGKKDCVQKIREIYNDLNLSEVYFTFMKKRCSELRRKALEESGDVPADVYLTIINNFFKRDPQAIVTD